jgi:hypothetical protein
VNVARVVVTLAVLGAVGYGSAAEARPAAVAPTGDDVGVLQWTAAAQLVLLTAYDRGLGASPAELSRGDRATLRRLRAATALQLRRVRFVLQAEAPRKADFLVVLPRDATVRRARLLAFARRLERLIAGVTLDALSSTADPGTRALLARHLAQQAQHVAALGRLAGGPLTGGLLEPVTTERASVDLDRWLRPGPAAPPKP